MNYKVSVDLAKVAGAQVVNENGQVFVKIPADWLFVSQKGGYYLTMTAWEQEQSQYGDTHYIKQSFTKEVIDMLTDEERKAIPTLGRLKPKDAQPAAPRTPARKPTFDAFAASPAPAAPSAFPPAPVAPTAAPATAEPELPF